MGDVYRDSTVTISAMSSPGSKHGILPRDKINTQRSPSAEIRVFFSKVALVTFTRANYKEETIQALCASAPLSQRDWVMQKLVLSPRHLFYGADQVYWRCHSGFDAADGPPNGQRAPNDRLQTSTLSRLIAAGTETPKAHDESYRISLLTDDYVFLQLYIHRRLTVGSDILLAFSGITSCLQSCLGGHYLARLWSTDIVKGLLWKASDIWCRHSIPYRAPSWSRVATEDPVTSPDGVLMPNSPQCLELVSYYIALCDAANPFGEILAATLMVKGLTMPLVFRKQLLRESGNHPLFYGETVFDEPPPGCSDDVHESRIQPIFGAEDDGDAYLLVRAWHSTGTEHGLGFDRSAYTPEEYLALIAYVDGPFELGVPQMYTEGLILRPGGRLKDGPGSCYERVVTLMFYKPEKAPLDRWRRRTLTLV